MLYTYYTVVHSSINYYIYQNNDFVFFLKLCLLLTQSLFFLLLWAAVVDWTLSLSPFQLQLYPSHPPALSSLSLQTRPEQMEREACICICITCWHHYIKQNRFAFDIKTNIKIKTLFFLHSLSLYLLCHQQQPLSWVPVAAATALVSSYNAGLELLLLDKQNPFSPF